MKPIILLTHKSKGNSPVNGPDYTVCSVYATALTGAGAVPIVSAGGDPDEMTRVADALLLTGGIDIDPSRYGEENVACHETNPVVDDMEIGVFNAFLRAGKPVLGICRGHQLINVALGGTLYQDVALRAGSSENGGAPAVNPERHPVRALKDSVVGRLFGERFNVNSFHHQALKKLGEGLRATAWNDDGVIEAIEHVSRPVIGVQWHPERMTGASAAGLAEMTPFIKYFLSLCRSGAID